MANQVFCTQILQCGTINQHSSNFLCSEVQGITEEKGTFCSFIDILILGEIYKIKAMVLRSRFL